jgi:hypothetical protein
VLTITSRFSKESPEEIDHTKIHISRIYESRKTELGVDIESRVSDNNITGGNNPASFKRKNLT